MAIKIFDQYYKKNLRYYILQSLFACFYIFLVLIALTDILDGDILGAIGVSSIASSSFISFSEREALASTARPLIGGYFISVLVGAFIKFIIVVIVHQHQPYDIDAFELGCAAIAVGLSMFFMLLFDMKHPPAAGITVGLVLETWQARTIVVIFSALVILFFIRLVLKPYLRDLI